MTITPVCEHVETAQGVPLTVTGVAQCKIITASELLQTASEQFLGKSIQEIMDTVLQTLEGHLRAILGKSRGVLYFVVDFYIERKIGVIFLRSHSKGIHLLSPVRVVHELSMRFPYCSGRSIDNSWLSVRSFFSFFPNGFVLCQ